MASQKVIECSKALVRKNWTIAFVESATAGKMCYEFSTVSESGKILLGGLVSYDASIKEGLLGISKEIIDTFTPESAEVTENMAVNFRRIMKSDVSVAITGLTTPGGSETREKPVGTIFMHIIFPVGQIANRFEFKGNPEAIVNQAIDETAAIIVAQINNNTT